MKRLSVTLFIFCTFCAHAQKTLLPAHLSHGVYCAPHIAAASFGPDHQSGLFAGGRIGWIIEHRYTVGIQASQLWTNIKADWTPSEEQLYLNFSYAGIRLSYCYRSEDVVHIELFALYGGGVAGYRRQEFGDYDNVQDELQVFEPGMAVELNMTHFMRLGASLSYLVVHGIELPDMSDQDFSGPRFALFFMVGIF